MLTPILRFPAYMLMALGALLVAPNAFTQEVEGPVILTISGNVANPNRGAVDQFFVYS